MDKFFYNKDILSSDQFSLDSLEYLFSISDVCMPLARGEYYSDLLRGAVLGSLFFEASTRTRLSFDAAFMRLGGSVSATTGVTFSSLIKGESIEDTGRVVSGYFDICVLRHPDDDVLHPFSKACGVPVINAGNGSGEHPTQALLDMYAIRNEFSRCNKEIKGSIIVMAGDLRYGRTVHSLSRLLSLYKCAEIRLVSPEGLALPEFLKNMLINAGHQVEEYRDINKGIKDADLVYMTRIQQERIPIVERELYCGGEFRLDKEIMEKNLKNNSIVMHPLPRDCSEGANDLSSDMDHDQRIAIFRQSDVGVPVRMALFASVLGVENDIKGSMKKNKWK